MTEPAATQPVNAPTEVAGPVPASRLTRRAFQGLDTAFPLRGRPREQSAVQDSLDALEAGYARNLVIVGSAGAGKTRLLSSALETAGQRGILFTLCRPGPESQNVPLGAISDILLGAEPPFISAEHFESLVSAPESRYWLIQQIQERMERAAAGSGIVVFVDDLQWCDTSTLAVFRSLIRHLRDMAVTWIVTVRSGGLTSSVSDTISALTISGSTLDLSPLSDDDVSAMISDRIGVTPGKGLLRHMEGAEHMPLLVLEMLRALSDADQLDLAGGRAELVGDGHDASHGQALVERITRLPSGPRELILAASILGRQFRLTSLAQLMDTSVHDLALPLVDAIEAGLLTDDGTRVAFRHDLLRDAAESLIPAESRRILERRAAAVAHTDGEYLVAIASRLLGVAQRGDLDAAATFHSAAQRTFESDAALAAQFARAAIETENRPEERKRLIADLLPVLWQGGLSEEAQTFVASLEGSLPAPEEASLRLGIARLRTESSFRAAADAANAGLQLDGIPAFTKAGLLSVKAQALAGLGEHDAVQKLLDEGRPLAQDTSNILALATFDASESIRSFYRNRFDDASKQIVSAVARIASLPGTTESQWLPESLWLAFLTDALGDPGRAERIAAANVLENQRRHNATATAYWMMVRARALFDQGHLRRARATAEAVLDFHADLPLGQLLATTVGYVLFRAAVHQGDRAGLDKYRPMIEDLSRATDMAGVAHWLLALEADENHDRSTADAYLTPLTAALDAPVFGLAAPADFLDDVQLCRMLLRRSDSEHVAKVVNMAVGRARANPSFPLATAVAHHVVGLAERSVAELSEAVAAYRTVDRRLALACALEDLGVLQAATAEEKATMSWLESADLYDSAGATHPWNRVRRRLRTVGVSQRATRPEFEESVLSSRELQVAERVAAGRTTQQIADDLFLSPHTVTTYVRNIYGKWKVASRKDLAARFRNEHDRPAG
nr:AAA family ATPase [Frondihabitans australicus]